MGCVSSKQKEPRVREVPAADNAGSGKKGPLSEALLAVPRMQAPSPIDGNCSQLMAFGPIDKSLAVSSRSFGIEGSDGDGKQRVVVKVLAAGINMSDVKMIKGLMPYVKPPVIMGRDYSGVVVQCPEGREDLLNKEVYGVGARGMGCRCDGTHSQYLSVPVDCVALKPSKLTHEQAGTLGVPYFTAYACVVTKARTSANDIVVVQGANGMVGTAALQIAKSLGATTVALVRRDIAKPEAADFVINMAGKGPEELAKEMAAIGKEATVFIDTVGGDSTSMGIEVLGFGGRLVVIAAPNKDSRASFSVHQFYRKRLEVLGYSSQQPPDEEAAAAMKALSAMFEKGDLKPLPVSSKIYTLEEVPEAMMAVAKGVPERLCVAPWGIPSAATAA